MIRHSGNNSVTCPLNSGVLVRGYAGGFFDVKLPVNPIFSVTGGATLGFRAESYRWCKSTNRQEWGDATFGLGVRIGLRAETPPVKILTIFGEGGVYGSSVYRWSTDSMEYGWGGYTRFVAVLKLTEAWERRFEYSKRFGYGSDGIDF